MQRLPLSVAVITLNEEKHLPRCLASVRELASEIVVMDSGSTDRTAEIARNGGAVFVSQPWQGFNRQKNLSLDHCTQPWALCLDADEVVSPELADSIRQALVSHPAATGFFLNRRTRYLDDWIWHAWYPEWRLRLVRREAAHWVGADPHPSLETTGPTEKLTGDLLHYSYANLQDHFERTLRYARISADSLDRAGWRCRWYHLTISPWLALWKRLLLKRAFLDGRRGWIIAYTTFFGVLAKYAFLFEKQTRAGCSQELPPIAPPGESSKSHSPMRPHGR
jgi:glycosyltransferase involved in cell wall biosynthesis